MKVNYLRYEKNILKFISSETRHTNGFTIFTTNKSNILHRTSYITPVDSNDWSFGRFTANGLSILRPSNILTIW